MKKSRSSPPSAQAFASSATKTENRHKTRNGSGVFEPFHSAHGPADDSWRSLQDLTFRRRIQRCASRALGSKTRGAGKQGRLQNPRRKKSCETAAVFSSPSTPRTAPQMMVGGPCRTLLLCASHQSHCSGYGVFKPFRKFRSLYSAPLRDPPLRARPHSVESTVVCCTWLRKYRSPPFEFHASAVHGNAEHRSTRQVVVRAYGRAPKALHRHQTALATDIESSRLAAPAIVARIQPVVH